MLLSLPLSTHCLFVHTVLISDSVQYCFVFFLGYSDDEVWNVFRRLPCPVQLRCGWWFKKNEGLDIQRTRYHHGYNNTFSSQVFRYRCLQKLLGLGLRKDWWPVSLVKVLCVTRRSTLPLLGLCLFVILMRTCLHWRYIEACCVSPTS